MNILDATIFQYLNSLVGPPAGGSAAFDAAVRFGASRLIEIIVFGIALFVVFSFLPKYRGFLRRNIEMAVSAAFAAVLSRFVFAEIIRFFYDRARPFEVVEGARALIEHPAGHAFPSGHASASFAIAAAVAFYYPKTSIIFFAAALLNGIARVSAGVHWPSDILGGAVLGIISAWIIIFLGKKFGRIS